MRLIKAELLASKPVTNALHESAVEGNLGAQVFYLKKRDRGNWQDRFDYKVETDLGQLHLGAMRHLAQEDKGRVFDAVSDRPALEDQSE